MCDAWRCFLLASPSHGAPCLAPPPYPGIRDLSVLTHNVVSEADGAEGDEGEVEALAEAPALHMGEDHGREDENGQRPQDQEQGEAQHLQELGAGRDGGLLLSPLGGLQDGSRVVPGETPALCVCDSDQTRGRTGQKQCICRVKERFGEPSGLEGSHLSIPCGGSDLDEGLSWSPLYHCTSKRGHWGGGVLCGCGAHFWPHRRMLGLCDVHADTLKEEWLASSQFQL